MLLAPTRILRSATLCGSALALSTLPAAFAAEATQATELPPIIRSEEDVARGRENVRSVINELTELFADDAPLPVISGRELPMAPPYFKIIRGKDKTAKEPVKEPGQEQEQEQEKVKVDISRSTLIFRPRFTAAKPMWKTIDGVLSGLAMVEHLEEQNELVINAPTEEIENYKEILMAMDIPTPQILIEAKVIEVVFNEGMQRNLSINFQGNRYNAGANTQVPGVSTQPSQGAGGSFTPYAGKDSMNIAFQWLLTAQDAKVLTSPNILISRNETSQIVTGEEIPIQEQSTTGTTVNFTTTFKNVGVTLEVEPSMINNDNVTLRVYPKVSNVLRYETISGGGGTAYSVPVISARSVETHLRMQNRQVVMMGGLYNSRTSLNQQRVPILSDLPLVGELFTGKNESKEVTHLIFFLKVHIIPAEEMPGMLLYDFDRAGKASEKIGEIVEKSDSVPIHETSIKKFGEELQGAGPGQERRRREEFRNTPIDLDAPLRKERLVTEPGDPEQAGDN